MKLRRSFVRLLSLSLIGTLLTTSFAALTPIESARAAVPQTVVPSITTRRSIESKLGHFDFELRRTRNEHDELELGVTLIEKRPLMPDFRVTVLYGRDTRGTNRINTWFVPTGPATLDLVERDSSAPDGWDVAEDLLENVIRVHNRNPFGILLRSIHQNLTFNGGISYAYFNDLQAREMDLLDLEARADHTLDLANRLGPSAHDKDTLQFALRHQFLRESMESLAIVSEGWRELDIEITQVGVKDHVIATLGDIALAGIAAGIARGATTLATWIGGKVSTTAVGELAIKAYVQLASRIAGHSARLLSKIRIAPLVALSHDLTQNAVVRFVNITLRKSVATKIETMEAKGGLSKVSAKALIYMGKFGEGVTNQLGYIARTQAIQVGAEIFTRPDMTFVADPVIMTKKVTSNKEFMLDFDYMTVETLMQAGIHKGLEKEWSQKQRLGVVAMMSFIDSTTMNLAVKHETDRGRIALDTSWEVSVGNVQTKFDIEAGNWANAMAKKSGNPKLRLLGVAFGIVDQAVGYVLYSKVSQGYDHNPNHPFRKIFDRGVGKSIPEKDALDKKLSENASTEGSSGTQVGVIIPIFGERE